MRLFLLLFFIFFKIQYLNALEFKGKFEQGSFVLGKTFPNSKVTIDNKKIRVSRENGIWPKSSWRKINIS